MGAAVQWLPTPAEIAAVLADLGFVAGADLLTNSDATAFARGQIGYRHTDFTVRKAIDTSALAAEACYICIASAGVAAGASGLFLACPGVVKGLTGGVATGLAFVGNIGGDIANVPPTTPGRFRKPIGRWISATVLAFDPMPYAQPDEVF